MASGIRIVTAFRIGAIIVMVGLLIVLARSFEAEKQMIEWLTWFDQLGIAGHLLFIAAILLVVPLMLPNTPLELGAGVLFPYPLGLAYAVLAQSIGSMISFLLARHLLPERFRRKLMAGRKYRMVTHAFTGNGWKSIALTRLIPGFPFKASNYGFGLTPVGAWAFFIGNLLGIIPRCMIMVYAGMLIGDLTEMGANGMDGVKAEGWPLLLGGIVALLVLALLVHHARRKGCAQPARPESENQGDR